MKKYVLFCAVLLCSVNFAHHAVGRELLDGKGTSDDGATNLSQLETGFGEELTKHLEKIPADTAAERQQKVLFKNIVKNLR